MKNLRIITIGIASLCAAVSLSSFASSVKCLSYGQRAACHFIFGDDHTPVEKDVLNFQCVISPSADYNESYSDIKVDMWNTNVKTGGLDKWGKLNGISALVVNRHAFANKWKSKSNPKLVQIKIVKGHGTITCKSANEPTRPVYSGEFN